MNPATQEFHHTYETLKEELAAYKTQQNETRLQISKLIEENKRLYSELRDNARRQELQSSESGYNDLEKKFEAAVAAKNAAVEMWQLALMQLDEQEQLLIGKKSLVEVERSESGKVMDKVKEEYVRGLNILSTEVTNYRSELSDALRDLRLKTSDLEKCKRDLETALEDKNNDKRRIAEMVKSKVELEGTVDSLKTLLSETESFLIATKEEMAALKTKNGELSSIVTDLKDQNRNLRSETSTLEKDAKESLITAQEAVLRRKEMAYREEQYLKDIEHLKSSVNLEAEKLSFRHKAELKKIQKESSEKVRDLMEEIETLHRENSDKQSLFEKATREKQALESKLELLYSECSRDGTSGLVSEDLCRRLTMAEKSRDEQEFRVRTLETELEEVKSAKEQELRCARDEQEALRARLEKVMEDFNRLSSDRLKLCEEATRLKKTCYNLEKDLKKTKDNSSNEIASLKEELCRKEESFTQRLKLNEERYKRVCCDLQGLLDAELGISSKRKEVVEDVIAQSEAKIKELYQTIVHLQNQNKDLSNGIIQDGIYASNYAVTMNR